MPKNYEIKHTQVGPFEQGRIVTEDQLAGIDIARLVAIKAIAETESPKTQTAVPLGPHNMTEAPPIAAPVAPAPKGK